MGSETIQLSIFFSLHAKGRFWFGTYGAHVYIPVSVCVTVIYHAN